jgi:hypothetical protein
MIISYIASLTLLFVLSSSTSGDQNFCEIVTLYKTAGSRFARDNKSWGPSWGKQLPGKQLHETAET